MTNWQIEVGRMALYIFFPIGTYYYASQSEYVSNWIDNERKKYDYRGSKEHVELLQLIDKLSDQEQMNNIMKMEEKYSKHGG